MPRLTRVWNLVAGGAWMIGCATAAMPNSPEPVASLGKSEGKLVAASPDDEASAELEDQAVEEQVPSPVVDLCRLEIPGARAEASPFDGGIGVVITTEKADEVEALRDLAHRMEGEGASYFLDAQANERSRRASLRLWVRAQDIDDGVFMMLAAKEADEGDALAGSIRRDVEELNDGACTVADSIVTSY
jgi:hypothetical protein